MLEQVPLYPLAPVLFVVAAALFALQVGRHLRVFATAQPSAVTDQPESRLDSLIRYAIVQVKMFRDPAAGWMHAAIFWGFIVLGLTLADRLTAGLVHTVLGTPLDGWLWRLFLVLSNLMMLAVLAGIAVAVFRRVIVRPRRLTLSRDGVLILLLIGTVVGAELLAEAFRIARYGDPDAAWAWAADAIAQPLGALPPEVQAAGYSAFFWIHIAAICTFLAYLPRSKHLHIATAFFNTTFRKLAPRGRLPMMDLEADTARFGVKTINDLAWKDLLDGFTCTECGRCQDSCPAWSTGKPLNPKTMIMGIREMAVEAEAGVPLLPWIKPKAGPANLAAAVAEKPIVGAAIPEDAVWDCVTCGACVEACPVLIEHVDKIVGLRRNLVLEESRFPPELTGAMNAMERYGNPWGQPASARLAWTKGLPFSVPTAAEVAKAGPDAVAQLEVLYWVGCAAAFDDRNKKVARAFVTCLDAAGVRYAVLGQEESCTGDPARRMGNEYVFQMLAQGNIATLDKYRPKTIVTACPHCFNTIGNEYGQLGGHYEVVHHSAFLAKLVEDGRLKAADPGDPAGRTKRTLTYHDSCYLARYNGVMAEPRAVLGAVPDIDLREMERSGKGTFCCGAGGGRMWMEETRGTRINAERTRQALDTGAETVATACPFCLVMLKDGLADAGDRAGGVQAQDVAEILAASLPVRGRPDQQLPVLPAGARR
ncbi:MAG: (Fe-S)-binding protein [Chloroflexota bacterium]